MNLVLPFDVNCRVCGGLIKAEISLSPCMIAKMYEDRQDGYLITIAFCCPYCRAVSRYEIGVSYEIVRKIYLTDRGVSREEVKEFQRQMNVGAWTDSDQEPSACN